MPTELDPTAFARPGAAAALRDAALSAGVSLDHMVRTRAVAGMSRPKLIGAGLLLGGAVVALAHLVGADLRGGLAGGQPTLLHTVPYQDPGPQGSR